MNIPMPMPGCYVESCPKCKAQSPCVDHNEVDIGVGIQTFDHRFYCPTHGEFSFNASASWDAPIVAIFRDDEESAQVPSKEQEKKT